MRPYFRRTLVPLALAVQAFAAWGANDLDLERALLDSLRSDASSSRQERAGLAIRQYKAAGVLPFRPQRSDYTDYYIVGKPTKFMGNDLVLVAEEYQTKYIGCCVNPGAGVYVRVTTNTDSMLSFARANSCRVEEFADRKTLLDSTPVTAGMEPGKYAALLCHESDEREASQSEPSRRPSATAAPAAPKPAASPLVGEWTCQSRKPDGSTFTSAYRFASGGNFAYADGQVQLVGTYQPDGPNAAVAVEQVTRDGRTSSSRMRANVGFISVQPGHLKFDMTLVRLGSVVINNCVSKAVAAATPAPQVNVCDVNPAACAAIQRNHDIRSPVQDQRCQILRSQLSGVLGGDYQLAKAGCR